MKTVTRDEMLKMPEGTFYRWIDLSYEPDDYRSRPRYGHAHFKIKCNGREGDDVWNVFKLNEPAYERESYEPKFFADGDIPGGYEVWDKEDLLTLKGYIDRALEVVEDVKNENGGQSRICTYEETNR